MRKLLSAGFTRLRKDKFFWAAMTFMVFGSVYFSWMTYDTSMLFENSVYYVEDMMFNLLPAIGFVCAVFISLRVGTEFDDHTIRNKLIVGHTRSHVFFSEYLTCMAASEALLIAMLLFSGVAGYMFFGEFLLSGIEIAYMILCCVLLTAVFSTMCVGISINIHSRAISVVVSILLMLAIFLIASHCGNALDEEPMTYSYVTLSADGVVEFGDLMENPFYVSGKMRTVYELIYDVFPSGQAIQLHNMECERISRWPWLSVIVLVIVTVAGCVPFRKWDIR